LIEPALTDTTSSYTDFLVYEILKDGSTLHLEDFEEEPPRVQQVCSSTTSHVLASVIPFLI